jgi:hypothetical protein
MVADKAAGAPDDFRRLLVAQLQHTYSMLGDYVKLEGRGYGEGQMPHEWGSVDSYDYMNAALELSQKLLEAAVEGDPQELMNYLANDREDVDVPPGERPMTNLEMDFACDGVAPALYTYFCEEES